MAELSDRITADLVAAMKSGDTVTRDTLRMVLTAYRNEQVAGKTKQELDDATELRLLTKEVAKRRESVEIYTTNGRPELAAKEDAEIEVLQRYLPAELGEDELDGIVADAVAAVAADLGEQPGPKQMGLVMKIVSPKVAGRADGAKVAAKVRAALA
ncbi:MAG: GatB/YqeY domain-containing protein [Propionibacteriaceae bacterium]|jgi:uncharacterized protein YqeY|nr:GatB/YqeY domain-containing protein [Propionibacteriaceae bacterium]